MGKVLNKQITDRICTLAEGQSRVLVSISGPPGAGKSTLAEQLERDINERMSENIAVILPMDGYHLDNAVLEERGQMKRKGAPHTFDVAGFAMLLERVKAGDQEVAVPVFDRSLDLSRAGARIIDHSHQIVLVEGNYLLLDQPPWAALYSLFDLRLALEVDEGILTERLVQRWRDHGLPEDAAVNRAESNDLPNARLVASRSQQADCIVSTTADGGYRIS